MTEALEKEIRTLRAHFWSERDPDGRAFAPLADAYLRKGDLDEAHALLDDGLGRLPQFTSGHLVAARVHRARGDESAFRNSVERLLELDGANAAGLRLRGEILEGDGDLDGALECFERALDLNPEYDDLESRISRLRIEAPDHGQQGGPGDRHQEVDRFPEGRDLEPTEPVVEGDTMEVPDVEASSLDPEEMPDGDPFADGDDRSEDAFDEGDFSLDTFGSVDLDDSDPEPDPDAGVDTDPFEDPGSVAGPPSMDDPDRASTAGDPFDLAWEEGTPLEESGDHGEEVGDEVDDEVGAEDGFELKPSPEAALESDRGSPVPDEAGWAPGTGSLALSDADREVVLEGDPAGELPDAESPIDPFGEEAPESSSPDESTVDAPAGGTADAAPSGTGTEGSPTVTRTLGELYARQGLTGRAVEIFEELVRRAPDDAALASRLGELRAEAGGDAEPRGERPDSMPSLPDSAPDEDVGEVEGGDEFPHGAEAAPEAAPDAAPDDEPADDRAPQWTGDAKDEEAPLASTPFAWDRTEDPDDEVDTSGTSGAAGERTIAEYLGDLRAWEPGAIPVEALDPEAVPIGELAPEAEGSPGTPDASHPRTPGEEESPDEGGEGDLDDFQDWLRGLRS